MIPNKPGWYRYRSRPLSDWSIVATVGDPGKLSVLCVGDGRLLRMSDLKGEWGGEIDPAQPTLSEMAEAARGCIPDTLLVCGATKTGDVVRWYICDAASSDMKEWSGPTPLDALRRAMEEKR